LKRKEKSRVNHLTQLNEKPSVIPGCPGAAIDIARWITCLELMVMVRQHSIVTVCDIKNRRPYVLLQCKLLLSPAVWTRHMQSSSMQRQWQQHATAHAQAAAACAECYGLDTCRPTAADM